jgi:hypothetical protein
MKRDLLVRRDLTIHQPFGCPRRSTCQDNAEVSTNRLQSNPLAPAKYPLYLLTLEYGVSWRQNEHQVNPVPDGGGGADQTLDQDPSSQSHAQQPVLSPLAPTPCA